MLYNKNNQQGKKRTVLRGLHWLPVKQWIDYNVLSLTYEWVLEWHSPTIPARARSPLCTSKIPPFFSTDFTLLKPSIPHLDEKPAMKQFGFKLKAFSDFAVIFFCFFLWIKKKKLFPSVPSFFLGVFLSFFNFPQFSPCFSLSSEFKFNLFFLLCLFDKTAQI